MGYGDFNYNSNGGNQEDEHRFRVGEGLNTTFDMGTELSSSKFNLSIGLILFWGFLVNYIIVKMVNPLVFIENGGAFLGLIIGYIALALGGTYLCRKFDNPMISFIGYNMIVLPLGLVVSIIVFIYQDDSMIVNNAILVTAIVTAVMMILGTMLPDVFNGIASYLTGTLVVTIIAEILISMITGYHLVITDYIVAVMFCGYIGYDWGRAQNKVKTLDSAIDTAAELYLDIINLFLRLLSIMAKNSGKRR